MSPPKSKLSKASTPQNDLSTLAHAQIMDFLKQAEESKNPAVTKAALKLAEKRQDQQHRSEAKLTPMQAAIFSTLMVVGAIAASWVAIAELPSRTGVLIATITTILVVLAVCLYALFSGHLSEKSFIGVIGWVGERLKLLQFWKTHDASGISVAASQEDHDS